MMINNGDNAKLTFKPGFNAAAILYAFGAGVTSLSPTNGEDLVAIDQELATKLGFSAE